MEQKFTEKPALTEDKTSFPLANLMPDIQKNIAHFATAETAKALRLTSKHWYQMVAGSNAFQFVATIDLKQYFYNHFEPTQEELTKFENTLKALPEGVLLKLKGADSSSAIIKKLEKNLAKRVIKVVDTLNIKHFTLLTYDNSQVSNSVAERISPKPANFFFALEQMQSIDTFYAIMSTLEDEKLASRIVKVQLTASIHDKSTSIRFPDYIQSINFCGIVSDGISFIRNTSISKLPKCLKTLKLQGCNLPSALQLPAQLTSIALDRCITEAQLQLPPELITVKFEGVNFPDNKVPSLPSPVKRLTLTKLGKASDNLPTLPPSLEYLDLSENTFSSKDIFSQIPPTVTALVLRKLGNSLFINNKLPPQLKELDLRNTAFNQFAHFPEGLIRLGIGGGSLTFPGSLPSTLQELFISDCSQKNSQLLESMKPLTSLTTLTIEGCFSITGEIFKSLPKTLKYLTFTKSSTKHPITEKQINLLPPHLEFVNFTDTPLTKEAAAALQSKNIKNKHFSTPEHSEGILSKILSPLKGQGTHR